MLLILSDSLDMVIVSRTNLLGTIDCLRHTLAEGDVRAAYSSDLGRQLRGQRVEEGAAIVQHQSMKVIIATKTANG